MPDVTKTEKPSVDERLVAILEMMAKKEAAPKDNSTDYDERLLKVLEMLAAKQDEGPIKQIPISKAIYKTPWNPTGDPNRPEFARASFMNGFRLKEGLHSNEEIELFNQIKPGRYIGNKVLVVAKNADKEGTEVMLFVPNKTVEDRILQAQYAPTLSVLLKTIIAEQNQVKV
jgi:hypothetical protein